VRQLRIAAALLAVLLVLPAVAWAADDPYRLQQWALDRIRVDEAWAHGRGAGVVVAVVDTGVDLEHPELRDRLLRDGAGQVVGLDLVDDAVPADRHGHGTLVAGVIAATAGNGEGIAGVAPEARIMPIKALDDEGAGQGSDVDRAIRWAVDHGADVINLSLESVRSTDGSSPGPGAPTSAVRYAWERGVVVVAAVGNGGASRGEYPADSPVVLVGATDRDDRRAAFSDRARPDALLAPGVDIVSTWCRAPGDGTCDGRTHTYGTAEGTSFAAPHVSGALALLLGAGVEPAEAVERLRRTAVDLGPSGADDEHGAGRIDIAAALAVDAPVAASVSSRAEDAPTEGGDGADVEPDPVPSAATAPDPATADEAAPAPEDSGVGDDLQGEQVGEVAADDGPADDVAELVTVPVLPETVALPARDGRATSAIVLQAVAAAMVGASLAAWSSVARRLA
jgi:subtilisin family serine protease